MYSLSLSAKNQEEGENTLQSRAIERGECFRTTIDGAALNSDVPRETLELLGNEGSQCSESDLNMMNQSLVERKG